MDPTRTPVRGSVNRGTFWAVSCHFNPCRYAQRLVNHRRFRARLGIPLLTVELSHDGSFELLDSDADQIIRVRASDILWQKERLLNVGIASLPPACTKVAWLDSDVLFGREDWHRETARLLDTVALVQPFSRFADLPRNVTEIEPAPALGVSGRSFASLHAEGGHDAALFDAMWGSREVATADGPSVTRQLSSGFAWAARRELLRRQGLYDACIMGSGDRAIACAAYGRAATSAQNFLRNADQRRHYLAWADDFAASIGGRVSFVEGDIYHLWHGELRDRGYRERWRGFARFGFDPAVDIAVDNSGCWRWNSDKPEMHAYVRRYFENRREDGPDSALGASLDPTLEERERDRLGT